MKKNYKAKLLGAIAALGLAVASTVGSTYAWFASNTAVTATGMQVKVTTAKNLVISNNETVKSDEDVTKAAVLNGVALLNPVSVQTLAGSQKFFRVSDSTDVNYTSGVAGEHTVFEEATTAITADMIQNQQAADFAKYTYYIRVDGATGDKMTNLYCNSLSVTGNSKDISKAMRVGIVCGEKGFIYNPCGGSAEYKGIDKAGTGLVNCVAANNVTITDLEDSSAVLAAEVGITYTKVEVYVWYEGQDANCTSAKSIETEELTIQLGFTATAA